MEETDIRRWLDEFEQRLESFGRRVARAHVFEIRDQASLLLEHAFGADSSLAESMRAIEPAKPPLWFGALSFQARTYGMANKVLRVIRNARFLLELQTDTEPAIGLQSATAERLLRGLDELAQEVQAALELSTTDKQQLLEVLSTARSILEDSASPTEMRARLERILGRAVASAGRGGPSARLWRRVAEFVVIAEAAVSLGLGVAAIASTDVVKVEVTCQVQMPALPPGTPPITSPEPPLESGSSGTSPPMQTTETLPPTIDGPVSDGSPGGSPNHER